MCIPVVNKHVRRLIPLLLSCGKGSNSIKAEMVSATFFQLNNLIGSEKEPTILRRLLESFTGIIKVRTHQSDTAGCTDPAHSIWSSTWAADIQGKIQWNAVCTGEFSPKLSVHRTHINFLCIGYNDLGSSKVVLDDGRLSGGVMKDGRFIMYAMSVLS